MMMWEGVITAQLILILTQDAGLSASAAAVLYSFQYVCAIGGKLTCGLCLGKLPRLLVFSVMPLMFCLSHFLLLVIDVSSLITLIASGDGIAGGLAGVITVAVAPQRLYLFCTLYGVSFGFTHSLLTCQPAALFGRQTLPVVQNVYWAVVTFGYVSGVYVIGQVHDLYGSFGVPLLITFAASALCGIACLALAAAKPLDG